MVGGADLGDVAVALMKGRGRHHDHRHVDQPGDREREHDFDVGEAQQRAAFVVVARRGAVLGEAGMEIDRVRHHGRADDADRDRQRRSVGNLRQHRMQSRRTPVDRRDEHLGEIAKADRRHQAADDQFDRAEAAFEQQDAIGHDPRHDHAGEQRNVEQKRQADRAADEFGEVGRHGGDLDGDPQDDDDGRGDDPGCGR